MRPRLEEEPGLGPPAAAVRASAASGPMHLINVVASAEGLQKGMQGPGARPGAAEGIAVAAVPAAAAAGGGGVDVAECAHAAAGHGGDEGGGHGLVCNMSTSVGTAGGAAAAGVASAEQAQGLQALAGTGGLPGMGGLGAGESAGRGAAVGLTGQHSRGSSGAVAAGAAARGQELRQPGQPPLQERELRLFERAAQLGRGQWLHAGQYGRFPDVLRRVLKVGGALKVGIKWSQDAPRARAFEVVEAERWVRVWHRGCAWHAQQLSV